MAATAIKGLKVLLIPCLDPKVIEPSVVIEQLKQKQTLRKEQYDKGAKTLPTLQS